MDYDYKKIEDKMKSLPKDLQRAMASIEIANLIQDVAEKYKLDVENSGLLFDLTGYVMLGLVPSKKFVSELAKQLGIDNVKANQIATDINTNVFGSIKSSLQKIQADEATPENTNLSQSVTLDKTKVLNSIENPSASTTSNPPINLLTEELPLVIPGQKSGPTQQTQSRAPLASPTSTSIPSPSPISTTASAPTTPTKSINLMDSLMTAPASTTNEMVEKVEKKVGNIDTVAGAQPKKPSGPDPYREPIE